MTAPQILLDGVSRFYGEVLGVNNVSLGIGTGITSLVGSNGAGKTTLLNLITGLLRPTSGTIRVAGCAISDPDLMRVVGYATQFDTFPRGLDGAEYLGYRLRLFGYAPGDAKVRVEEVLERVGLGEARGKRIGAYSKGMRQRLQLAAALAHGPEVLVLDEPLNGLDPVGRAEFIRLFRSLAAEGRSVLVSSHILEEVDTISDHVVMMNHGHVVAEGQIRAVRNEISEQPASVLICCDQPSRLARRAFEAVHVVEARIGEDPPSVRIRTRDLDAWFGFLNQIVLEEQLQVEQVSRADEDTYSIYGYLVGDGS